MLQVRNGLGGQLGGEIAAHGVGMGHVQQIGTDGLDGALARSAEDDAPQIGRLTAIAVGGARNMVVEDGHGSMQGALVGQVHRSAVHRPTP